jgi:hypothetical protein
MSYQVGRALGTQVKALVSKENRLSEQEGGKENYLCESAPSHRLRVEGLDVLPGPNHVASKV